ncbi:beta-1,3-glucanase family protein [Nocardiopsis potens]|uniref:beta-1,3-glucanase family protein n=1 Tax=Nocardiopsis potens TaxID=1246458 RepID=UPI000345A205|nr:beta-1,3-glucanase family protein [Nocardiopsis potens]
MIDRRRFLAGLGGAAVAAGAGGALLANPPRGGAAAAAASGAGARSAALPVTIANETGRFADAEVLVYIVGTDLGTGRQCRATPDGEMVPVSESDNTDGGYTDYSIPLPADGAPLGLPRPMSGRIYFALGDKLRFKAVADGEGRPALQYPAGHVESDPNYGVLYDTFEFTCKDDGMYCNSSMVDQFSVPISIDLRGAREQSTGLLVEGGRDAIFDAAAADPDLSPLIVGDRMRLIAPGHGLDRGLFPEDYFAPYIDEVWAHYGRNTLSVTTNEGTFSGRVEGDLLVFDGGVAPIDRPSTRDVLFCDGALAAPNDGLNGPVAAVLGAGFNRSTLLSHDRQPTTDAADFYRTGVSNHYSRIMHANSADGKAYGFAFDDVAGFASYIEDPAPVSVTVTLTPF